MENEVRPASGSDLQVGSSGRVFRKNMGSTAGVSEIQITEIPNVPSSHRILPKEQLSRSFDSEVIGNQVVSRRLMATILTPAGGIESKVLRTINYEYRIEIFGDEFIVARDSEGVFLHHPRWTLAGEGNTVDEAKQDLLKTARDLAERYARARVDQLDPESFEFREYLMSFPIV